MQATGLLDSLREILAHNPHLKLILYLDDVLDFDLGSINLEQVIIIENTRKMDWLSGLADIDIGLLPSIGPFDQRQSLRTVLEYMVMKIPWVASQSSAYHEVDIYGETVENAKDNWYMKIEEMLKHQDVYKRNATQEPYLFGIGKSVDENIHHTIEQYEKFFVSKKR
jgi:hypothetical protein